MDVESGEPLSVSLRDHSSEGGLGSVPVFHDRLQSANSCRSQPLLSCMM